MTVLSEDSDEANSRINPRKKARLSRHNTTTGGALDNYQVITSSPVYINNYMETGFYSGGINGCKLPESPSCNPHSDDLSSSSDLISPIATLCNLGNTCFLNSVLYTLRFAPSFLHNLHHLVKDINDVSHHSKIIKGKSSSLSRLGSTVSNKMWSREPSIIPEAKMQCTSQLHEVYEELRRLETSNNPMPEPVHPSKFMQSLRAVNSFFEGNQQHDAHELFIFLLDNLRETSKDVFKFATQLNLTSTVPYQTTFHNSTSLISSPSSSNSNSTSSTSSSSSPPPPLPTTSTSNTKKIQEKFKKSIKSIKRFRSNNNGSSSSSNDNKKTLTASTNSLNDKHLKFELNNGDLYTPSSNNMLMTSSNHNSNSSNNNHQEQNFIELSNITEDFQGVSIIRTVCSECEHVKERKEVFCDICVPIINDKYNEHSSDKYNDSNEELDEVNAMYRNAIVTEEMLIETNKYWCEECLRYNEAKRCYRFETLPRLLTLHLKRFSSTGFGGSVSKVLNFMPTPFKLKCFCESCLNNTSDVLHSYDLYAVIMHLGSTIASGHYVSYVKAKDNEIDYVNCSKDKRKTNSLISNDLDKSNKGGTFSKLLFRPSKSNDPSPEPFKLNQCSSRMCRTSLDCCGIRIRDRQQIQRYHDSDYSTWLECDDDSVRTLSQSQFEDMLMKRSPQQGTPYILFYTRVTSKMSS